MPAERSIGRPVSPRTTQTFHIGLTPASRDLSCGPHIPASSPFRAGLDQSVDHQVRSLGQGHTAEGTDDDVARHRDAFAGLADALTSASPAAGG